MLLHLLLVHKILANTALTFMSWLKLEMLILNVFILATASFQIQNNAYLLQYFCNCMIGDNDA